MYKRQVDICLTPPQGPKAGELKPIGFVTRLRFILLPLVQLAANKEVFNMLSLGRKQGETIMIGDDIMIKVIKSDDSVRIGIVAPKEQMCIRDSVIGSDEDQSPYGPDAVLMSLTKSLAQAAADVTSAYAQGQFPGGTSLSYGLAEGGVDVLLTELVPQDLADKLQQLEQAIIRGDLQPPKDRPSYEEFIKQLAYGKMSA